MRYLKFICLFVAFFAVLPLAVSAETPLEKTVQKIENADYTLNIYQINTEEGVYEYLGKYIKGFTESNVELIGVTVVDFEYAENGTKNGSFSFFAELSYSNIRKTTKTLNGTISKASVSVTASSAQSSIFAGEECILSAEISDYSGGNIYWYESSSPNKNGKLLKTSDTTHITTQPDVGMKYYYCVYKGSVSNTVTVNVTEAFVPITDITLPVISLICGKSTLLPSEIYPENATKTSIVWKVTDGDASIVSDRITARTPGIITIKATVTGGSEQGGDYEKYFELYAEEGELEYKEVKWSISPSVSGISQMSFTANEKKNVQITAVSDLTANKMINKTSTHNDMDIITSAYIVCDEIDSINKLSIQIDQAYAGKEVHIISSDKHGGLEHKSLTVSDTGEIELPPHKISYVVTSTESAKTDLSFLILFLPVIPVILIPIFFKTASGKESSEE